jgi:hypothetical protein
MFVCIEQKVGRTDGAELQDPRIHEFEDSYNPESIGAICSAPGHISQFGEEILSTEIISPCEDDAWPNEGHENTVRLTVETQGPDTPRIHG